MALTSTLDTPAAERVLAEVCLRNLRGDVECFQGTRVVRRFPTRMLQFREGTLRVECPTEHGADEPPEPGMELELYFRLDGQRYSVTGVAGGTAPFDLTENAAVTALDITRLGGVQRKQRRNFYRLSVLGVGSIPVYLTFTEQSAPPGPMVMVAGTMVNISAGGMAVCCDLKEAAPLARADELIIRFSLPEVEQPFAWRVAVVHQRVVHSSGMRVLGLSFLESRTERSSNRETERVHQFVVAEQRRKIRRSR